MPEPRDVEQCEFMHVHEDIVAQVEKNMPDEEVLYDLAELSHGTLTPERMTKFIERSNKIMLAAAKEE